jgi:protein involved in polysaccharide export with SLBB domain
MGNESFVLMTELWRKRNAMVASSYFRYQRWMAAGITAMHLALFGLNGNAQDLMRDNLIQGSVSTVNFVTSPYKIAPGDVLSFSINEEPDFEQKDIIVRPDGMATIRPIGQVAVAGKNIEEPS